MSVFVLAVVMTALCVDGGRNLGVYSTLSGCQAAQARYAAAGEKSGVGHFMPVYHCEEMKVEG